MVVGLSVVILVDQMMLLAIGRLLAAIVVIDPLAQVLAVFGQAAV